MTQIGELTGDRIELNPDVPFPPFPIRFRVPSSWSRLDSDPGTWRRSADDLIDTAWRGSRLPARQRRDVLALLEGLVADCQRAGAAFSLITVGRRSAGGAASFGLHVAFASDGRRPATLGRVHDILPRTGVASEISTNSGPAVLHRDRMTMVVPGTAEIAALTSLQIFLPIPGTSWTVVLSTASACPELTDSLEALVRRVAESLTTGQDTPSNHAGVADEQRDEDWAAVAEAAGGPGFERGFGTMVMRPIGPPADRSDHHPPVNGAPDDDPPPDDTTADAPPNAPPNDGVR